MEDYDHNVVSNQRSILKGKWPLVTDDNNDFADNCDKVLLSHIKLAIIKQGQCLSVIQSKK